VSNDLDVILEVILGFFAGITVLVIIMVHLEQTLDRDQPTDLPSRPAPGRLGDAGRTRSPLPIEGSPSVEPSRAETSWPSAET
jgi:hypothetical protein